MIWLGKNIVEIVDGEIKVNPAGVDVKAAEIWKIAEDGIATFYGKIRNVEKMKIEPEEDGFYYLPKGTYEVRIASKVKMPINAVGFLLPRSSLNRLGILKSDTALIDPCYEGYPTQTIRVTVGELRIHKDEFWFQLIVEDTKGIPEEGYSGFYQGEKPNENRNVGNAGSR